MRTDTYVILIDDDDINIFLSRVFLEEFLPGENVFTYTSPQTLLEEISSKFKEDREKRFVFFVDINMPAMTGWELIHKLDELQFFDFGTKDAIYMLSSSINPRDREIATAEKLVFGFIEKPISTKVIQPILM